MPARRREAGFTMIELLITLSIAVIGMTGVLALHLATTRANANTAATADAITIAQQTLEDARALSLAEMYAAYDDDGALPIDYDFDQTTVLGRTTTYYRRIVVEGVGGSSDLLRLRVEISWGDDGAAIDDDAHHHVIALELLRTRQEAL
jgi:prepilin-type N-terminal cleavage/methylation domain-containing protein